MSKKIIKELYETLKDDIRKYFRIHKLTKLQYMPSDVTIDGVTPNQHQKQLDLNRMSGNFYSLGALRKWLNRFYKEGCNKVGLFLFEPESNNVTQDITFMMIRINEVKKKYCKHKSVFCFVSSKPILNQIEPKSRLHYSGVRFSFGVLLVADVEGEITYYYDRDKKKVNELKYRKTSNPIVFDKRKLITLFNEGLSDSEIAEQMNLPKTRVILKRRSLRLFRTQQMKTINLITVKELLDKGKSDKEIADVLNCSKRTIAKVRTKRFGIFKKTRQKIDRQKVKQMCDQGKSDGEIAQYFGCCKRSISNIKSKLLRCRHAT